MAGEIFAATANGPQQFPGFNEAPAQWPGKSAIAKGYRAPVASLQ